MLDSEIKFLASERLTDASNGGGRMTANVVVSGETNNVFPKVSRLDSVYGAVSLRKLYLAVQSALNEVYAGAHVAVLTPPANDRIHCCLFSTNSHFDTRAQARDRIESYVVSGPESTLVLFGTQLVGQRAILCWQRTTEPLPDVGEVYCLSVESGADAGRQQYVRVADVEHEVRTFTDSQGEFTRRVVTIGTSAPLAYTFAGAAITRLSIHGSPTLVRETRVADANKYYGIQPLSEAATAGDLSVRLASTYLTIVPSTQRETPLSLAQIGGAAPSLVSGPAFDSGTEPLALSGGVHTVRLATGFYPGTLRLDLVATYNLGGWVTRWWLRDAADGRSFTQGTRSDTFPFTETEVDYATAYFRILSVDARAGLVQIEVRDGFQVTGLRSRYTPAVTASGAAHTRQIPVTLGTRRTVYVETLLPIPAPGTLRVSYRALGRWYTLADDGAGVLSGNDTTVGTGSIDYSTGALILTLGALPDVDSAVLLAWGSPIHGTHRAGSSEDAAATVRLVHTLADPATAGSLVVTWPQGGVTKTATANAAGVISGHAIGTYDRLTRRVTLLFTTPPDNAGLVNFSYTRINPLDPGEPAIASHSVTAASGAFVIPGAPLDPGTIRIQAPFDLGGDDPELIGLRDDEAGNLVRIDTGASVGTVNYTTGDATISGTVSYSVKTYTPNYFTYGGV